MSRRFTEGYHRDGNVIDAETFNNEYDSVKGWMNGGLDRTSLEDNAIRDTQIVDNAFHNVWVFSDMELNDHWQTAGYGGAQDEFATANYDIYAGSWIETYSTDITGLKEGMLHVEFSCWTWIYIYQMLNPKWIQFKLSWNGLKIAQTGQLYTEWSNPFLSADVPIVGGSGTLSISVRYTPRVKTSGASPVDSTNRPQFFFGGAQLLAIGRWR